MAQRQLLQLRADEMARRAVEEKVEEVEEAENGGGEEEEEEGNPKTQVQALNVPKGTVGKRKR